MSGVSLWRLLGKAALLFVAVNLLFAFVDLQPAMGKLSLYNWLLPGRQRLPYGDDPARAYNLNLYNLDAMFASHELAAGDKPADEYRVLLIGDSSVWGFLLENEDTLAGALNAASLQAAGGRRVQFYNLGHPTISLTKDLMILDYAMRYEPDLIVWPLTLEAFPNSKQTSSPLVQNNAARVRELIERYQLRVDTDAPEFVEQDFWERTLFGQRRALADLLRLQLYGFAWAATGVDVHVPEETELRATDLEANEDYADLQQPLAVEGLAFDVLAAGVLRAGDTPVLIVNEPVFVSDGANSDIRYNSFYPRWAYDAYRELMLEQSAAHNWNYVDLWQAASNDEFTNTPIHLTPRGTLEFATEVVTVLEERFGITRD